MADNVEDILMWIKTSSGWLKGETKLAVDEKDSLYNDVQKSEYTEIQDFDFGISLIDKDTTKKKSKDKDKKNEDDEESGQGKFYKFITAASAQVSEISKLYPVTFEEVKVSRQLDNVSTTLMTNCCNRQSLQQVTIIRRRAMGDDQAHVPFLRLDFENALITDISWEVDDKSMKETFKFICRKLTMKYRPQNFDGTLGVTQNSGPNSLLDTAGG